MAVTINTLNAGTFTFTYTSSSSGGGEGGQEDVVYTPAEYFNYDGNTIIGFNDGLYSSDSGSISNWGHIRESTATVISNDAFSGKNILTTMTFDKVTNVGTGAFANNPSLQMVSLPGVTNPSNIGVNAFSGDSGLTSLYLLGCTEWGSIQTAAAATSSSWGVPETTVIYWTGGSSTLPTTPSS